MGSMLTVDEAVDEIYDTVVKAYDGDIPGSGSWVLRKTIKTVIEETDIQ